MIDLKPEVDTKEKVTIVKILEGEAALRLIADPDFAMSWDSLYEQCPWATVFQKQEFVTTWYRLYQSVFTPVVVLAEQAGRLTGLLTLAAGKGGELTGAGTNQAEYHVWLAMPDNGDMFIVQALQELRHRYPKSTVAFKYLPASTPLNWLSTDQAWQKHCILEKFRQPIMTIDDEHLTKELRKKNRREKMNRLKRLGDLRFERITDYRSFEAMLDELAIQYDFRKGATVNLAPFKDNPLKRDFLLNLFELGVLHVTVLMLNDAIIASNVGLTGKNWVHLQGLNTHSPFLAKHSPGILQFLMLGKCLHEEGIAVFDLTPGGDSYKDALATDTVSAYKLTVGPAMQRYMDATKLELIQRVKAGLAKAGIEQSAWKNLKKRLTLLKGKAKLLKHQKAASLTKALGVKQATKTFACTVSAIPALDKPDSAIAIKENCLKDILSYNPKGSLQTRWEFLELAMKRFESGYQSYTWTKDDSLVACVWLSTVTDATSNQPKLVLQDVYSRNLDSAALMQFLEMVMKCVGSGSDSDNVPLYLEIPASSSALIQKLLQIRLITV